MKKNLILCFWALAICVYAQQGAENEIPFLNATRPTKTIIPKNRDIVAPLEGVYYFPYMDARVGKIIYQYDRFGVLRSVDYLPDLVGSGFFPEKQEYNGTFLMEHSDVLDTLTIFREDGITPIRRTYYNYHYYDKYETDSFFYEEIRQSWDIEEARWKNGSKQYFGYADTVLWNMTRRAVYTGTDTGWKLESGHIDSLIYNEVGLVTGRIFKFYSAAANDYLLDAMHQYRLNEDGSVYEYDAYQYKDGGWNLLYQYSDVTWTEWHGYWGFDPFRVYGGESTTIGKVKNKQATISAWYVQDGEHSFIGSEKNDWSIDNNNSHIDTAFVLQNDGLTLYARSIYRYIYDEHGNAIEIAEIGLNHPNEDGEQSIRLGIIKKRRYLYNEYGLARFEAWDNIFVPEENRWDSTINTMYKEEVTKWGNPLNIVDEARAFSKGHLSIYPNPARDNLYISATEQIEQINLYDLTGRLLKEDYPKTQQTELPAGNLVPGVYLLKARLKSGAVKTEKVIVR